MEELIIIQSEIFKKFSGLVFGFSTKKGGVSPAPLYLNLSYSVGDDPEYVKANRKLFFDKLGIPEDRVTFQRQIHSSEVNYSGSPTFFDGCDAIYTDKKNIFLTVSTADCIPVFVYSPEKNIVAGIHAGWKGTSGQIVFKTIQRLNREFSLKNDSLHAFIGPGICSEHYEVGAEVAGLFDESEKKQKGHKFHLDLKKANFNQLIKSGLNDFNIEVSDHCTFCNPALFHSYRRDGEKAGRMLGVIGMI